jgi:hypothetical protein
MVEGTASQESHAVQDVAESTCVRQAKVGAPPRRALQAFGPRRLGSEIAVALSCTRQQQCSAQKQRSPVLHVVHVLHVMSSQFPVRSPRLAPPGTPQRKKVPR